MLEKYELLSCAYSCIVGIALFLVGATGLVVGIPGVLLPENILYLSTGVVYLYVGFWLRDVLIARAMILGMGMLYLFAGALVLGAVYWLNLPDLAGKSTVDDAANVVFGIVSILFGWQGLCRMSSAESDESTDTQRQ